jgi:hypothetical protein
MIMVGANASVRNPSNLILVSLTLADFSSSTIGGGGHFSLLFNDGSWIFGRAACRAWMAFDDIFYAASVLSILAIAFDRCA